MSDQGVGIVIVSHSCPLGRAAADLASQMLPGPEIPPIEVAAGLDDTTLGTDATAVSAAAMPPSPRRQAHRSPRRGASF